MIAAVLLVLASSAVFPLSLRAEAVTASEGEAVRQRFVSLRGTVYTRVLRSLAEHDWAVKLRVRAALGLYEFRTLDALLIPDSDNLESVGLRPSLEFEYPLPLSDVSFVPVVELVANHVFDGARNDYGAAATAALRYRRSGDAREPTVTAGAKYGTRFEDDGLNIDDYLELAIGASLKQSLGATLAKRRLIMQPFAKASYFVDDLELETSAGPVFEVSHQFELGLEFNVSPRLKLWKIGLPGPRISYVFGDDVRGIRIRF